MHARQRWKLRPTHTKIWKVTVATYEFERKHCLFDITLKINQFISNNLKHFENTSPCPDKIYTLRVSKLQYF